MENFALITEKMSKLLQAHEGLNLIPYEDSGGHITIGYGHLIRAHENLEFKMNVPITLSRAEEIFQKDYDLAIDLSGNFEWFWSLNHVRKLVIVELIFNLGASKIRSFKKFLGAVERGDWETAANELLYSKWAKQVGETRSNDLASLIRTGDPLLIPKRRIRDHTPKKKDSNSKSATFAIG